MQAISLLSKLPAPQPSTSRHQSISLMHRNSVRGVDVYRAIVQAVLTDFVTDTMYDKPEDVLRYMVEWARMQQEVRNRHRASIPPTPPPRLPSMTPLAPRPASAEQAPCIEPPEVDYLDILDATADKIMALAQRRQEYLHSKAEGCRDHYLMSLEDSDDDILHINALQKKMAAARKNALDARVDVEVVEAKMTEIGESADTGEAKVQKLADLLQMYEHQWVDDLPKGHLN
ncbi:hypothetical protein ABL78_2289 [Leptomonas seymouri]|uniref:Uncharacterized protein n=1 Tax=Leptomonas seymouri TaxID=5684 RepID=A0A0N1I6B4_LEPSE|nr:hypothetical protein ABL78_2289 [Leptomonas seymouri]|eukprot:KPI88621.1 hypothetical protein ABL78_2289 [Leptomonas seymouri]